MNCLSGTFPPKSIHNELFPVDDIGHGCSLGAAAVGHACPVKGEQDFSGCGICTVELAVALAEGGPDNAGFEGRGLTSSRVPGSAPKLLIDPSPNSVILPSPTRS